MSHSLFPPIAFLDDLQQSEVVVLTLVGVILVTAAFLFGRTWARWRGHRAQQERNERMFQIEKSLSDFYEHEKRKFLDEKAELEERIVRQEKQITELRRKAAGVTGKKDARADLMLQLLVENEQLQEKLFEENVRQKEERDRALGRELHQISYQRVLLSNLLSERGVQEAVVEILGDERRSEKRRAGTPSGWAPQGCQHGSWVPAEGGDSA
ncbi:MAG: hypothetical protein ACO4BJ_07855 [Planctomycetota bacterium]